MTEKYYLVAIKSDEDEIYAWRKLDHDPSTEELNDFEDDTDCKCFVMKNDTLKAMLSKK